MAWGGGSGADRSWLDDPRFEIAPVELVAEAPADGVLSGVATRELGMLLLEAGGGRSGRRADRPRHQPAPTERGSDDRVEAGQELARLYVQPGDEGLRDAFERCFPVEPEGEAPPVVHRVVRSRSAVERRPPGRRGARFRLPT